MGPTPLCPPHIHPTSLTDEFSQASPIFHRPSAPMNYCQRKLKSKRWGTLGARLILASVITHHDIWKWQIRESLYVWSAGNSSDGQNSQLNLSMVSCKYTMHKGFVMCIYVYLMDKFNWAASSACRATPPRTNFGWENPHIQDLCLRFFSQPPRKIKAAILIIQFESCENQFW